jgi:hypothetical protein
MQWLSNTEKANESHSEVTDVPFDTLVGLREQIQTRYGLELSGMILLEANTMASISAVATSNVCIFKQFGDIVVC